MYNILDQKELDELKKTEPQRFQYLVEGGVYLNLKGLPLKPMEGVDVPRVANLARIVRGYAFAAINGIKSGHPGGSSSKVEQVLAMLCSGVMAFNPLDPKHCGRDRIIWSAGHCTPILHAVLALIYETYNRNGVGFEMNDYKGILPEKLARFGELHEKTEGNVAVVMPKCLSRFRHCDGPTGHVESNFPLADASTGSSGHGFSAALGLATLHKSCGLDTKVFVIAGDAETEEGMSYEARNLIRTLGMDNMIISLDYNGFGIDGPISEVISAPFVDYWFGPGWNVIEVDGHNVLELAYAYHKAGQGFGNKKATVVICNTVKGKYYGKMEGTAESHGTPAKQEEYVEIMKKLGFDIPGIENEVIKDIDVVSGRITKEDVGYLLSRLEINKKLLKPEKELVEKMAASLQGRPMVDYKKIKRPEILPPELVFEEGKSVATRKATEAFFKWLMGQTAFFYLGAGDLMKSILTGAGENVYGVLTKDNPLGRGIRFGIAEQNMAMMSTTLTQDVLPGGFQAMSIFASYGVFTSIMSNSIRMALINNAVNPRTKGFFIVLAAHDGPETGEDGPTHHGLFWMSLYNAYPGIKVYKPLDANETIEMLFHAMNVGEPVAFSVMRPGTPVLKRGPSADGSYVVPPAREAVNGAYVFKPFKESGKRKIILAICGGQVMQNVLEILPELEDKNNLDVKIVAVTSPELYEELKEKDPAKAQAVLSDEERQYVITLHNGWPGFMHPFVLPADYGKRVIGINKFLKSGPPTEVYQIAGFDPPALKEKILRALPEN
jgi:transketolase